MTFDIYCINVYFRIMSRPARIEYPNAFYHIMNRGNRKEDIFYNDGDRYKFLEILAYVAKRYRVKIYSFVLMPNHYHLLLQTPLPNLSRAIQRLNGNYALFFSKRHDAPGHLFQGRFKAMLVEKDSYLLELSRYIHLNPFRAGITKSFEKYRWSSLPVYLSGKSELPFTLQWEWILSMFGGRKGLAIRRYQQFMYEGISKPNPSLKTTNGWILGGEKWIKKVLTNMDSFPSRELSGVNSIEKRIPPEGLDTLVCKEFKVSKTDLSRTYRNNLARHVIIYIAIDRLGLSLNEAYKKYGGSSYYAVGQSVHRFRKRLLNDKNLTTKIDRIMSNVKM